MWTMQLLCQNVTSKKREYYDKLNINSNIDNKLFWKSICPLFSAKKLSQSSKITLLEKGKIAPVDTKIGETFKTFSSNIIKTLTIEKSDGITCNTGNGKDAILGAIN